MTVRLDVLTPLVSAAAVLLVLTTGVCCLWWAQEVDANAPRTNAGTRSPYMTEELGLYSVGLSVAKHDVKDRRKDDELWHFAAAERWGDAKAGERVFLALAKDARTLPLETRVPALTTVRFDLDSARATRVWVGPDGVRYKHLLVDVELLVSAYVLRAAVDHESNASKDADEDADVSIIDVLLPRRKDCSAEVWGRLRRFQLLVALTTPSVPVCLVARTPGGRRCPCDPLIDLPNGTPSCLALRFDPHAADPLRGTEYAVEYTFQTAVPAAAATNTDVPARIAVVAAPSQGLLPTDTPTAHLPFPKTQQQFLPFVDYMPRPAAGAAPHWGRRYLGIAGNRAAVLPVGAFAACAEDGFTLHARVAAMRPVAAAPTETVRDAEQPQDELCVLAALCLGWELRVWVNPAARGGTPLLRLEGVHPREMGSAARFIRTVPSPFAHEDETLEGKDGAPGGRQCFHDLVLSFDAPPGGAKAEPRGGGRYRAALDGVVVLDETSRLSLAPLFAKTCRTSLLGDPESSDAPSDAPSDVPRPRFLVAVCQAVRGSQSRSLLEGNVPFQTKDTRRAKKMNTSRVLFRLQTTLATNKVPATSALTSLRRTTNDSGEADTVPLEGPGSAKWCPFPPSVLCANPHLHHTELP